MIKNNNKHIKKLQTLKTKQSNEININNDNEWFVNKTNKNIPTNSQWLLSLGPKYALPVTRTAFPLFNCIAEGEDCIQTFENKEQQEASRTKLITLIDDHLNKTKLNQREKIILDTVGQTRKFLKENNDILILSADKGNKTVAMNKSDYDIKMKDILKDFCTYRRMKKDPTSGLQTKNNILIDKLFNQNLITEAEKNRMINRIATSPRIYGLPKIHKAGMPLRPICSLINSPSYGLCKYIINILKNLTTDSQYNVKDAKEFKSKINNTPIENDEILISFDVISLFPSIPVNLALRTIERKWDILEKHTTIPKDLFIQILSFCIKDTRYFKFEEQFYEQLKGMPMGSPASPVIADIVMEELLDTTMELMDVKPRCLTKYVDDLFGIIKKDKVDETLKILNSYNRQIQFTMEKECDSKLPYLDSIIIRQGNLLKLDWYQKPSSSGRLINFYSKHPKRIIINTATNFINRVIDISDYQFHRKNFYKIKETLRMNDFPKKTINDLIKRVRNKRPMANTRESDDKIFKSISYIPNFSERMKNSNIYNKDKFQLAFKCNNTVNKLFSKTKSKLKTEEKPNVVYKINCKGDNTNICQKAYVGTTKTKLKTRLSSHKSDLKAIYKPLEQKTALAAHCAMTGHTPNFDDVKILVEESNYYRRFTLEMLHILNLDTNERLNYKLDTENISAHTYKHTIHKNRKRPK